MKFLSPIFNEINANNLSVHILQQVSKILSYISLKYPDAKTNYIARYNNVIGLSDLYEVLRKITFDSDSIDYERFFLDFTTNGFGETYLRYEETFSSFTIQAEPLHIVSFNNGTMVVQSDFNVLMKRAKETTLKRVDDQLMDRFEKDRFDRIVFTHEIKTVTPRIQNYYDSQLFL